MSKEYYYTLKNDNTLSLKGYIGKEKHVIVPETIQGIVVTEIGEDCFSLNESIEYVELPDTINIIMPGAFSGCINLKNISMSRSVKHIYKEAFKDCIKLESISVPENTILDEDIIDNCPLINSIEYFKREETSIINRDLNKLDENDDRLSFLENENKDAYLVTKNKKSSFDSTILIIPSSYKGLPVVGIADKGFINDREIEFLQIPSSLRYIGNSAFSCCTHLKRINVYESCVDSSNIDCPSIILDEAFWYDINLETVKLPNSIEIINKNAFNSCYRLAGFSWPSNIKTIKEHAFFNTSLQKSTISNLPNGLSTLENVFSLSEFGKNKLEDEAIDNSSIDSEKNLSEKSSSKNKTKKSSNTNENKLNQTKNEELIDDKNENEIFDICPLPKSIYKKYIRVEFPDGKKYFYYSYFDVKIGDIVCVEGKKTGTSGIVTEIMDKMPNQYQEKYILYVTDAYRYELKKDNNPSINKNNTKKDKSKENAKKSSRSNKNKSNANETKNKSPKVTEKHIYVKINPKIYLNERTKKINEYLEMLNCQNDDSKNDNDTIFQHNDSLLNQETRIINYDRYNEPYNSNQSNVTKLEADDKSNTNSKKSKITFAVIVVIAAIILMIVGITKCAGPMNKYNEAMSEINKGNYITAASLFKESNYADGIKQSNMAWAHQFATKGDYDSLLYNVISASGSVNVTYDTNGGDYIPAENISTYGHGITKKATREGFSFTRWTLSNYYIPHIQNTYTASMTLKAVWDKATYDISYELSGGEISSNAPKTYIYGKDCYIPNPTKNGYTFEGWSKNNSTVKYKDLNLKLEQGNVTLKAYWSYDGDRSQTYSNAYNTITNHILKDGTITSSDPLTYQLITKTKNVGNETHLGGFIYKPNFNTFYFNFKHYKTANPSKAIDYSIAFPQEMTSINTGTIFVDNRNDKFALHTVPQDLTKGDQLILTLEFNLSSDEIDTLKTDSETAMSYYTSYFKETLDILGYKLGDFGFNNF